MATQTYSGQRVVVEMRAFEDQQIVIDSWTSFSMRETFTDPVGDLVFETIPTRDTLPRINQLLVKGQLVLIYINGAIQGVYIISGVRRTLTRQNGAVFACTAKTLLHAAYEASVNPRLTFSAKTDVPVADLILQVMAPFGFSTVIGDNSASVYAASGKPVSGRGTGVPVAALKHQDCQAQEGETAYAFCARIVNRLGVVLRQSYDAKLLVCAPDYAQAPLYTVAQSFNGRYPTDADVMLTCSDNSTNDGQFSEVRVRGTRAEKQSVNTVAEPDVTVPASVLPTRSAYSSTQQFYKPRIIKDKTARDIQRSKNLATLALSLPAINAYQFMCEVPGVVSATGAVWQVDTVAQVVCDAFGINEPMWILERELSQDRTAGQRTRLKLIPIGALVLGELPQ